MLLVRSVRWSFAFSLALLALPRVAIPGAPATGPKTAPPFERTEERAACSAYEPLRKPLFGDLHVHSRLSFDAYVSGVRTRPADGYRFARGEKVLLPDVNGAMTIPLQLQRPLDFASITDHAELYGEIEMCTGEEFSGGRYTPICFMTRSDNFWLQLLAASGWADLIGQDRAVKERTMSCSFPATDCAATAAGVWEEVQAAAEAHYDRTAACRFTTFVGYEYTESPGMKNLHRNVIYRNDTVTREPISSFDTGGRNVPELWRRLKAECRDAGTGCDVLAIPHNSNLSGGLMFPDPQDEEEARNRLEIEPIVELVQHKASSECRFDRLAGRGIGTQDELCTFEQNKTDSLNSLGVLFGEMQSDEGAPVPVEEFARRNVMRNVLKDGLELGEKNGVNPFRQGFIGSTDTHSNIPGATMEFDYPSHLGKRDTEWRNVQDHFEDNPGGLAVAWAEENSRDAIFAAMQRRETYATSGTRPILRFFGGFDLPADLCGQVDAIEQAYAHGVPMGGELANDTAGRKPRFYVSAVKDAGTPAHPGTPLQRAQLIKLWLDEDGNTHERVIDVAGGPNGAGVDPATCAPIGEGHDELCSVFEDEAWQEGEVAAYYVRLLENPTCRWSTLQCRAAGVDPFASDCARQAKAATAKAQEQGGYGDIWGNCCRAEEDEPFYSPVIQERAWSSPIWIGGPQQG